MFRSRYCPHTSLSLQFCRSALLFQLCSPLRPYFLNALVPTQPERYLRIREKRPKHLLNAPFPTDRKPIHEWPSNCNRHSWRGRGESKDVHTQDALCAHRDRLDHIASLTDPRVEKHHERSLFLRAEHPRRRSDLLQ
jgi:hypothetical protein